MAYSNSLANRATGSISSGGSANLGDILERVLDKGLVIAGDIKVNLLDIELLTIKLRLVVASLETAREVGLNWWESDPWLSADPRQLADENQRLRERVAELEGRSNDEAVTSGEPESSTSSGSSAKERRR